MIGWLKSLDVAFFRLINNSLSCSFFDWITPILSDSPWFPCLFLLLVVVLAWRGGPRGRVCAWMLVLTLCLGNWLICDSLKRALLRPRPFQVLPETILRLGAGSSGSMPSSHAANWFGAAFVLLIYYRRTIWLMLPMAMAVAFSRVYGGVHYPSDVAAGGLLGAGYSAAIIYLFDWAWQKAGPVWFPIWKQQFPSFLRPRPANVLEPEADPSLREAQWLRLGYLLTGFVLLLRLVYLASGKIELSEDEAYQWLWSKHLALSYYSKPPAIAVTQFLGTHLFGDTEFGVRFFSLIIAAILALLILRFMTKAVSGRAAFVLLLIVGACPLLSLGSVVMTVDPLSVLFWTAAMLAGWRALAATGTTRDWAVTGLFLGLGLLSKYTNLVELASFALFFLLWPPARMHLRRPGPWLALAITAFCATPILIWNSQHHWITVAHVASDGALGERWHRLYTGEFLLTEAGILNPFFFAAAAWAAMAFWRRGRGHGLWLYFFSMGAPLFLMYFLLSFHSRVLGNWIAPAIIPFFCLMICYWAARWHECGRWARPFLIIGLGLGVVAVIFAHDTQLLNKLIHRRLPARADLLRRVEGWKETALTVEAERQKVSNAAGPGFIICDHYGMAGQISFYDPAAKMNVSNHPLVFYRVTAAPENQFYFWPNYLDRTGQDAIFVQEVERARLRPDWFKRWWHHQTDLYLTKEEPLPLLPQTVRQEFLTVENLGVRDIAARGNVVRRIQLFACRQLLPITMGAAPKSSAPGDGK